MYLLDDNGDKNINIHWLERRYEDCSESNASYLFLLKLQLVQEQYHH